MRTSEITRTAQAPALSTCFSEEFILKIANSRSLSKSQLICLFILLIKVGPCCQEYVTSFPTPTLKRPLRNFSSRTAKADARGWGKLWDNRKSSRGRLGKQKIQVWARLDQKQKEMWVTAIITARVVFDVWVEEMCDQAMAWSLEKKGSCVHLVQPMAGTHQLRKWKFITRVSLEWAGIRVRLHQAFTQPILQGILCRSAVFWVVRPLCLTHRHSVPLTGIPYTHLVSSMLILCIWRTQCLWVQTSLHA